MLKYFEKAWCYVLLIILVILLRKMVLHDPNGNSQIIKRFVKCSLSYWVLAHPTLQQLFKSFSYTLDIELLYLVVISVLC